MFRWLWFWVLLCAQGRPACAQPEGGPVLDLQQKYEEAWRAGSLDFRDSEAVFTWVFQQLPAEVMVLPTENYYYWRLMSGGREIRGNFRPASGLRERGFISFAYAEWLEFPDGKLEEGRFSAARLLGAEQGLTLTCPDGFTCEVSYQGKKVRFRLHQIPQLPPRDDVIGQVERFVSRTWDESGLPFFLCYDPASRSFFWVLNEEKPVAEFFTVLGPEVLLGRRTGFVFWKDRGHANRKILTGVRDLSIRRNDPFDGPFDQLADNYAAQVPLRKYVEEAFPSLKNGIDLYGYFTTGPDKGNRVALTSYLAYETTAGALEFSLQASRAASPVAAIAAGGKNR